MCENSKIEKQECRTYLPVSARTAEWCNESYTELYKTDTGILISRVKTSELDLNMDNSVNPSISLQNYPDRKFIQKRDAIKRIFYSAEIRFDIINFSGYCNYCYDRIQDFDEAGIDCGGNCQACSVSINRENLIFNNNNMNLAHRNNNLILIAKFALLS
ncbi:hypothetical protein HYW76_05735 [Candidatus Pacearchaeota archaeon]|nr:hypothetical protein [Candidatus Pacearchaeota archaeon]